MKDAQNLNFTEFRSSGARIGSNYIAITQNGSLSLYRGFCQQNKIENFSHCVILYDAEKKVLGIQFGGEELGDGAFPLNQDTEHKTANIAARNFFRLNTDLSLADLKGRYSPQEYKDPVRKNVFIIDLTEKK